MHIKPTDVTFTWDVIKDDRPASRNTIALFGFACVSAGPKSHRLIWRDFESYGVQIQNKNPILLFRRLLNMYLMDRRTCEDGTIEFYNEWNRQFEDLKKAMSYVNGLPLRLPMTTHTSPTESGLTVSYLNWYDLELAITPTADYAKKTSLKCTGIYRFQKPMEDIHISFRMYKDRDYDAFTFEPVTYIKTYNQYIEEINEGKIDCIFADLSTNLLIINNTESIDMEEDV